MENMLRVGVITSTHGVRGEVKVFPTTDDMNRFKKLKTVILDTGKEQKTLTIEHVKFFNPECTCPKCGKIVPKQEVRPDTMLFNRAQSPLVANLSEK